jgi:hypothetical protein
MAGGIGLAQCKQECAVIAHSQAGPDVRLESGGVNLKPTAGVLDRSALLLHQA